MDTVYLTTAGDPQIIIVGRGLRRTRQRPTGLPWSRPACSSSTRPTTMCSSRSSIRWQPRYSPPKIVAPIRHVFRGQADTAVVLATVTGVDAAKKLFLVEVFSPLPYDFLVLATGVRHSYFGHDEYAAFYRTENLPDAVQLRNKILGRSRPARGPSPPMTIPNY